MVEPRRSRAAGLDATVLDMTTAPHGIKEYVVAPTKPGNPNHEATMQVKKRLRKGELVFAHNDGLRCPRCLQECYEADHKVYRRSRQFQVVMTVISGIAAVLIGIGYFLAEQYDFLFALQQAFEAFMVLGGLVWAASPTYYRAGGWSGFSRYSKPALAIFFASFVAYLLYLGKVVADLVVALNGASA